MQVATCFPFAAEVKELVIPFATDGMVELQIVGEVIWRVPKVFEVKEYAGYEDASCPGRWPDLP